MSETVLRWTIARCDPLVTHAYRQAAEDGLRQLSANDAEWFAAWASGVLADLVETLDPEDPWRHTVIGDDGTVVLPDGSTFGTWHNATDLLPLPADGDPSLDVGLAGVAVSLGRPSARLWFAAQTHRESAMAELLAVEVGGAYPVAAPAIERAMFRRRVFVGQEDAYIPQACLDWTLRASRIVANQPWDEAGAARLRAGARVEPGSWRLLA
ncbi:hypothetical protein [Citricoccus sp. GCM10030269]|uniref:hypothetical protein n=1 Tax=Citricoccus sp. GCM10030269 TaxID=3273388 RepID=UPI00360D9BDC